MPSQRRLPVAERDAPVLRPGVRVEEDLLLAVLPFLPVDDGLLLRRVAPRRGSTGSRAGPARRRSRRRRAPSGARRASRGPGASRAPPARGRPAPPSTPSPRARRRPRASGTGRAPSSPWRTSFASTVRVGGYSEAALGGGAARHEDGGERADDEEGRNEIRRNLLHAGDAPRKRWSSRWDGDHPTEEARDRYPRLVDRPAAPTRRRPGTDTFVAAKEGSVPRLDRVQETAYAQG